MSELPDAFLQQAVDLQDALRALWPDRRKVYFREGLGEDGPVLTEEEQGTLKRVAQAISDARDPGSRALERIRRLHRCDPHGAHCASDGEDWPCATRRLADREGE
jgi:hypothetical protein